MEWDIYWGGVVAAVVVFYLMRVEFALRKNTSALNEVQQLLSERLSESKVNLS